MGQNFAVVISFSGVLLGHLVRPVLAHSQSVAPAKTVDCQGLSRFDRKVALAGDLPRVGIRCRPLSAVKIKEGAAQTENGLECQPFYGDIALGAVMISDWTRPETPRSDSVMGLLQGRQGNRLDFPYALSGSCSLVSIFSGVVVTDQR